MAADLDQHATKAFKKAINLMPNEIQTYNRLGIALRKQKKYLEAIQEYQKALQKEPENEVILYNVSIAYYNQGLKQEAKTTLEKLLRINPSHTQAAERSQKPVAMRCGPADHSGKGFRRTPAAV